jgi:hypothetical protein
LIERFLEFHSSANWISTQMKASECCGMEEDAFLAVVASDESKTSLTVKHLDYASANLVWIEHWSSISAPALTAERLTTVSFKLPPHLRCGNEFDHIPTLQSCWWWRRNWG